MAAAAKERAAVAGRAMAVEAVAVAWAAGAWADAAGGRRDGAAEVDDPATAAAGVARLAAQAVLPGGRSNSSRRARDGPPRCAGS